MIQETVVFPGKSKIMLRLKYTTGNWQHYLSICFFLNFEATFSLGAFLLPFFPHIFGCLLIVCRLNNGVIKNLYWLFLYAIHVKCLSGRNWNNNNTISERDDVCDTDNLIVSSLMWFFPVNKTCMKVVKFLVFMNTVMMQSPCNHYHIITQCCGSIQFASVEGCNRGYLKIRSRLNKMQENNMLQTCCIWIHAAYWNAARLKWVNMFSGFSQP